MNRAKLIWHFILWANWAIILIFWFQGSGMLLTQGLPNLLIAFGRLAGLVAAYTILQQFFFMGRLPWLERVFGLDRLARLHQRNGKLGFFFLIVHPILLIVGYRSLAGIGLWQQLISFLTDYQYVMWAMIGLALFMIVIGTSIHIARSRLRYESWYFVHLLAYGAVFFSFFHQIKIGPDLLVSNFFYSYWIALYIAVFASHLTFRFARPVYLFFRHRFIVTGIERESPSTVSVYLSGKELDKFRIQPGQFMIMRFFTRGLWWQAHPFSLSLVPNGTRLRITVKELGDFTRTLKDLKEGTKVMIDGPYGVFTDLFSVSPKVLMIAGGIGITPIRSLAEQMLAKGKDVVLLYGNKTANDIVFKDELAVLEQKYQAKVAHVISDEPGYQGEKGYIDEEKLRRLVPDLPSREVYLCGPVPMMEALVIMLQKLGVGKHRIHYEKFSL